jgi:hypothetical protein
MDKENVVHLQLGVLLNCLKKKQIMNYAGKLIELEKLILS